QFTVTVGTVFERSKIPLTKWWMAAHLMNQGKNGVSAHEISRSIGVTYKTAWFMMHRLREAMADLNPGPMGATGGGVQQVIYRRGLPFDVAIPTAETVAALKEAEAGK